MDKCNREMGSFLQRNKTFCSCYQMYVTDFQFPVPSVTRFFFCRRTKRKKTGVKPTFFQSSRNSFLLLHLIFCDNDLLRPSEEDIGTQFFCGLVSESIIEFKTCFSAAFGQNAMGYPDFKALKPESHAYYKTSLENVLKTVQHPYLS